MGVEAFLVSFQGFSESPEAVLANLKQFIDVSPNPGASMTGNSTCWVLHDGQHKLEAELRSNPSEISLRFAMCNPRSIDRVFLQLIRATMQQDRVLMRFCEDCEEIPEWFTTAEMVDQWQEAIQRCIEWRRHLWHQDFGDAELPATCAEAWQHVIEQQNITDKAATA